MKSLLNPEMIQKTLVAAGICNILLSLGMAFYSSELAWQAYALFVGLMGLGYIIVSWDSATHWPIIFIGFIGKILVSLLFIKSYFLSSATGPLLISWFLGDLIWIVPFYFILINAYEANTLEESAPKKFNDLIKFVRTNKGNTLYELSEKENVLLVFVRHFGCTFCRETVSEIAKLEKSIEGKKLTPVFVHMSDLGFADEFFSQYYAHPISHISDPQRFLYKSLNLKRGTFFQIFGPKVLVRGLWAGLLKGHGIGALEGDYLQLGGYFILSRGQIVFEHKSQSAADFFELELLPEA